MDNLRITKESIREAGTCVFCQRGELQKSKVGLKYPYRTVYVLRGNTLVVAICEECIKIIQKIKC